MARIFISYSRKDEPFARRLAESLSDMGADVWIDVEDIPAGMKWSSAIQQGLDSGELLIVIISPESMASHNVEDEWQYYLDHGKAVVPVLLEPAKIHFQLNRLQYIDFHAQPFDIAINQLYAELRRKGLTLAAPAQPQPPTGQTLPNFDRLTPEEIDRALAELQKRRQQYDPGAAVPYPTPRPARMSGRMWITLSGVVGVFVLLVVAVLILQNPGAGSQITNTPSPTETTPPDTVDTDNDGLSDVDELNLGTNPDNSDTDEDGIWDGVEINETQTDPLNADTDGDGLSDYDEIHTWSTDPLNTDTDGDGKSDGQEVNEFGIDPLDSDTDDDSIDDGDEILGCTNPLSADTDGDGLDDKTESEQGVACEENTPVPALGFSADNPITSNGDWTPVIQIFGDMQMVLVPTGGFTMGTAPNDLNTLYADCEQVISDCRRSGLFNDESPTVAVSFDQPFWIGRFEVTHRQFNGGGDDLPRTNVTWADAQQFCEGLGMRLPTEREWEYASRGPDSLAYPWGNQFSRAIFNYCDKSCNLNVGWKDLARDDGYPELAPVGSFPASVSWVGAQDMAGNVWEWTGTIYRSRPADGYEDASDVNSQRTLKGSSWNWIALEARGAARSPHANNYPRSPWYGFRCAKDFDPADLS